jgi:hypothetical protein
MTADPMTADPMTADPMTADPMTGRARTPVSDAAAPGPSRPKGPTALRRVANYGFSGAFYQAWRRQTPVFGHRNGIVAMRS